MEFHPIVSGFLVHCFTTQQLSFVVVRRMFKLTLEVNASIDILGFESVTHDYQGLIINGSMTEWLSNMD